MWVVLVYKKNILINQLLALDFGGADVPVDSFR